MRQVGRLTSEEIEQAISVVLNDDGRVVVYPDGVAVVADSVLMLRKVADVLDQVEAVEGAVWCVQFYIMQDGTGDSRTEGVDVAFDIDLSSALADLDVLTGASMVEARAALRRELSNSTGRVKAQPLFLLLDGTEGQMKVGEVLRLPKKSVSPEGTVETLGYEEIDVGLQFMTIVRESAGTSATLSYNLKLGEVVGYIDGLPRVTEQEIVGQTRIASGGTYLLGRLERWKYTRQSSGVFSLGEMTTRAMEDSDLLLWAMVERVGGPAKESAL